MNEDPTLASFLTSVPGLETGEVGSRAFERWHRIFTEHMVNRYRAVTENLHPKWIADYDSRLRQHLAVERMTGAEAEAAQQLRRALIAGDEHWQRLVLWHLGLDLDPEKGITALRRSVLVHVFRHRRHPVKEPWYRPDREDVEHLIREGYIDTTGGELSLTEEGLAAGGVLMPRVRYNTEDGFFTVGPEAHGALIGPMRRGEQAVVKLLAVTDY
jgi:hypothetical protein